MSAGADRLTLLTSSGVRAVKKFWRQADGSVGEEGYGRAKHFTAREIEVDDRGAWLKRLAAKSQSFVVLGDAIDWPPGELKRRLSSDRDGDEATLKDCARGWMPVDVDKPDFEPISGVDDGESFALQAMGSLDLKGRHCVWHLTNSHGIKGKWRIRLWVMLRKPATCAQMKAYAEAHWGERVDQSVYNPAQPIYTGDPIFVGMESPVSERVGCVEGEPLDLGKAKAVRAPAGPPADENVEKLAEAGLYIGQLKPGQHKIRCPWEDAHTEKGHRDDDTFYFEPHYNGHDIPAFKCHHAHCGDKKWRDVETELGISGAFTPISDDQAASQWIHIIRGKKFRDPRDGEIVDVGAYAAKIKAPDDKNVIPKFLKKDGIAVERMDFIPGSGLIVPRNGVRVLNTYVDLRAKPNRSFDQSPLIETIDYLIPNENERNIFCDWMAHAYQHPELKILWALILYGIPGNGKTSVQAALAQCIGAAYEHMPVPKELRDVFNGWCYQKLLVRLEELKSDKAYDITERLQPVITNSDISIRLMRRDSFKVSNFANVWASTNKFDSLPIQFGDRRYMVIDTRRSGVDVTPDVVTQRLIRFNEWMKTGEGLQAMAAFLADRDVKKFDYAGQAPATEIKGNMKEASVSRLDGACDVARNMNTLNIVTGSMLIAYLSACHNDYLDDERATMVGYVAGQLQWLPMTAVFNTERNKTRIGRSHHEAVWSPTRSEKALRDFAAMSTERRESYVKGFNANPTKMVPAPASEVRPLVPRSGSVVPFKKV